MADYPISNVPRRVQYVNSGVGPYAFAFEVLTQTDIAVYRGSTLLTLTTDYTVTINANGTGSITLVTAGTGNITIVGARAIQRSSDYTTGGDLFASTLNTDLDSQTIFSQQLAEDVDLAIKVPVYAPSSTGLTVNPEANALLGWDSTGTNLINIDAGSLASIATYATAYADVFVSDGIDVTYTLSRNPGSLYNLDISVDGVTQEPVRDYSLLGTVVTFTSALPINSRIVIKYKEGLPNVSGDSQDIRYVPAGTGAVTTTVQAKLRETVSVKDFGAVGDGVTDDTAAIQNAIDSGAETIFFPDGDYLCGGLTVPDNIYNIEGTGTLLANADSITVMQVLTDISRQHTKSISGGLRILGNGFSNVIGLHLGSVGPSTNPEAVLYMSIRDITIRDCETGLYSNVSMEHVYENVVLVFNTIGMNFINDATNGGNNANTFIGMRFNSNTVGVAVINTATGLPLHNNSFIGCTFQENTTCGAYVRGDGVATSPYIQNVSFYNSHFEGNGTGTNVVIDGRTYQTCDIEVIRAQITVNGMDGGSSGVNFVKALQYSIINLVNVTGSPSANIEFVSNDGTCTIYENELVSATSLKSISSYGQLSGVGDIRVIGSPLINVGLYRNDSTMANPVVPLINNSTGTLANGYVKDPNFGLVSYVQFDTVAGSTASNRNYWLAAPASAGIPFIISFYVKASASSSFSIRTFNPGTYQTVSKTIGTSWQRVVFAGTNTASGIGVYIYPNDTVGATLYFKGLQVINSSTVADINNVYQNGIVGAKTLNYEQLSAAPTQGTWAVGDIIWNSAPASGGTMGWVCTTAGTPGTWKTFGAIS